MLTATVVYDILNIDGFDKNKKYDPFKNQFSILIHKRPTKSQLKTLKSKFNEESMSRAYFASCDQCPDGVFPFFMANSGAEKYELKNGPGIIDLVEEKTFNRDLILEEIQNLGFMCPFEPCESYLKQCPLDEFKVICDPTSSFGEMFLLIYSPAIMQQLTEAAKKNERIKQEARKKEEEDAAAAEAAEYARKNAVYVEKPFVVKPYVSETADATAEEVESSARKSSSDLLKISISYRQPPKKHGRDWDHELHHLIEIQPRNINENALRRKEKDHGAQVVPHTSSSSCQTNWVRKANKIVQYNSIQGDDADMTLVASSLSRTLPMFERALLENETIDIFSDSIKSQENNDDAQVIRAEIETQLKEIRNFTDLEHSKSRTISCIDWHPSTRGVVATSTGRASSPGSKINSATVPEQSFILIWDFSKWIIPAVLLKSPCDCPIFKFNPTKPNIVVAGCDNGQVILWEISEKDYDSSAPQCDQGKGSAFSYGSDTTSKGRCIIQPTAMSQSSHQRLITDLMWLPSSLQINSKGQLLQKDFITDETFQFMTIAGDGHVIFWDTRFELINSGQLPHIAKVRPSKTPQQKPVQKNDKSMIVGKSAWTPLYSIKTKRLDGLGELSPGKFLSASSPMSVTNEEQSTNVSRYFNISSDLSESASENKKSFCFLFLDFSLSTVLLFERRRGAYGN